MIFDIARNGLLFNNAGSWIIVIVLATGLVVILWEGAKDDDET